MMNLSIVHSSMVASGYLLKGASTEELYEAIKVVYQGGAMINPNIASKVFQIFSQMAKTNFSIAVDEDNVKDLSTTEWRIIQEVGYGESNKENCGQNFSYQKEPCAITYQRFWRN